MSNKKKMEMETCCVFTLHPKQVNYTFFGSKGIKNDRQCGINKAVQNLEKMDIAPACE